MNMNDHYTGFPDDKKLKYTAQNIILIFIKRNQLIQRLLKRYADLIR